jgi:beta-N-acetylhexosaminidase
MARMWSWEEPEVTKPPRYVGAALLCVLGALVAGCNPDHPHALPPVHGTPKATHPTAGPVHVPSNGHGSQTGWGPSTAQWLAARRDVAAMSDAELAGQVIVAAYPGTAAPVDLVRRYHLAGVIVLSNNISSVPAVMASNRLLQAADHRAWPLVIATDQEGGIVSRIGPPLTQFPTFMSAGAAADPGLTEEAARASGDELRAAGFSMVFAPDADVTIGPGDPTIGSRSAGGDPAAVATQVVAATRGYRASGIVSVIKHFPGHGSVTSDSHQSLPIQNASVAQLAARDWVPFVAAVRAGASAVMVGHIAVTAVDPDVPADLSPRVVSLLSSRLGFHGLVTTDALNMGAVTDTSTSGDAAVAALNAGADLLLMPADLDAAYSGILDAMTDGSLPRTTVRLAAAKIVALMLHEAAAAPPVAARIGTHDAVSQRLSARAITLVSGACHGSYVGQTVTPSGDPAAVATFVRAATEAGLTVGPGGTSIALLGYGYGATDADVVVSQDTPYVLVSSSARVAALALYGQDLDAMRALVQVLTGAASAPGHLPVSLEGLHEQRNC